MNTNIFKREALACLTAFCVISGATPAMAKTEDVGLSMETISSYTVTLPKSVNVTYSGATFDVKANGDIASNQTINISAGTEATLSETDAEGKALANARTIALSFSAADATVDTTAKTWAYALSYDDIDDAGFSKSVTVTHESIPAGAWSVNYPISIGLSEDKSQSSDDESIVYDLTINEMHTDSNVVYGLKPSVASSNAGTVTFVSDYSGNVLINTFYNETDEETAYTPTIDLNGKKITGELAVKNCFGDGDIEIKSGTIDGDLSVYSTGGTIILSNLDITGNLIIDSTAGAVIVDDTVTVGKVVGLNENAVLCTTLDWFNANDIQTTGGTIRFTDETYTYADVTACRERMSAYGDTVVMFMGTLTIPDADLTSD